MNDIVYNLILRLVKIRLKKPEIKGVELIEPDDAAIFVSNHQGFFGPLVLISYVDFNYVPWVTHEIMDSKLCREYLRKDFVEPVMHIKAPFSSFVSSALSPICISIMNHIGAIPVYKMNRNIMITMEKSVEALENGRNLLIFPEIPDQPLTKCMNKLDTGYINIAKEFAGKNYELISFYPICVNKRKNIVTIGKKIDFEASKPFGREKQKINRYLSKSINTMFAMSEKNE